MEEAKEKLVEMFIDEGAVLFGHFRLTSGKESSYYINVKKLITNPKALRLIAEIISETVKGIAFDRIAGPELGAVPIATAVALKTNKPFAIIRKKPKEHGTRSQIEGEIKPGERILLVEDVATTGESVLKAAEIIEKNGGTVVGVAVVVDREEGASRKIKEKYTFLPLLTVSRILGNPPSEGQENPAVKNQEKKINLR
ncbi:orotate phosphoribosyltransferase [Thermococcus sp.]